MSDFSAVGWGPFAITPRTMLAMLVLYLVLACASLGAARATALGSSLRLQIKAWWHIFPVVSVSLLFYPWGPPLLGLLIALLAVRELGALLGTPPWRFGLACAGAWLVQEGLALHDAAWVSWYWLGLLAVQGAVFALHRRTPQLLFLLFVLLCLGLGFIPRLLQYTPLAGLNLAWLFYLFALTALNDIAQCIGGQCFGRHKIAARISPQKNWQTLLMGLLASVCISVLLGRYLRLAGVERLVGLGICLSLAGFAGDLLFSAAKRRLGIKNYASLIPGHGGILDCVDRLVLTAPMLYLGLLF